MNFNDGDFIVWALNPEGNSILNVSDHQDFEECVLLADEAIKCGEYDKAIVLAVKPAYFVSADQMKWAVKPCKKKRDLKASIKRFLNDTLRKRKEK